MISGAFRFLWMILLALVAIPIIFMAYMTIADHRPPRYQVLASGNAPAAADTSLTVVTWNTGYAGLGREMDFFYDGGRRTRPYPEYYEIYKNGVGEQLALFNSADIILFQEVDRYSKRSYYDDQVAWLGSSLPRHHSYFALNYKVDFVPVPLLHPLGKVLSGLAVFSTFPADSAVRIGFEGNYRWPVRLFMLDRCFIIARFPVSGGKELVIINTHNSAFDDGSLRQEQVAHLAKVMMAEYERGNFVIAGGDWNINPPGYRPESITTGDIANRVEGPSLDPHLLPDDWKWAFDPSVPTNRSLREPYRKVLTMTTIIDFFVISPNISLEEVKTLDLGFEFSDHNPVILKVRLAR